jgi:hypothetical protein
MLIWGLKTQALFDVWSIEHFISGITLGGLIAGKKVPALENLPKAYFYRYHLYKILFFSFLWECIEHYLETGLAGSEVEYWFQGVEFWANRLITDPILVVLGYVSVYKYPSLLLPGRIFSTIWLFFHIVVFPHSMYLQTLF